MFTPRSVRLFLISLTLLCATALVCAGCRPNEAQMRATETSIAAFIYASLPQAVPTATPPSPPTQVPTPAPTLTITPPPTVHAVVRTERLNLREGPGEEYPIISALPRDTMALVTGAYQNCDWLLVRAGNGLSGWVKTGQGYSTYDAQCAVIPPGLFRPLNGALVYDARAGEGSGSLNVQNVLTTDTVMVLIGAQDQKVLAFYVRAGETFNFTGIPDGDLRVYYSVGSDWNWSTGSFTIANAYRQYNQPYTFTVTDGLGSVYLMTIEQSPAGVTDIPMETFPVLIP